MSIAATNFKVFDHLNCSCPSGMVVVKTCHLPGRWLSFHIGIVGILLRIDENSRCIKLSLTFRNWRWTTWILRHYFLHWQLVRIPAPYNIEHYWTKSTLKSWCGLGSFKSRSFIATVVVFHIRGKGCKLGSCPQFISLSFQPTPSLFQPEVWLEARQKNGLRCHSRFTWASLASAGPEGASRPGQARLSARDFAAWCRPTRNGARLSTLCGSSLQLHFARWS
jgi:hypothetical protein